MPKRLKISSILILVPCNKTVVKLRKKSQKIMHLQAKTKLIIHLVIAFNLPERENFVKL